MTSAPTRIDQTRPALGPNYRKLFSASVVSNIGDGIDATALPLLAAVLTRDPVQFAGVAVAARLPWLLFALQAGAIADRVDRRRLMAGVNLVRGAMMGLLAFTVVTDRASIYLLYVVAFGLGIAETLFDNAAQAIMPSVVTDRDALERANGRLFGGEIVANQFVGPPLGGILFAATMALPILVDAVTFLVSALLIAALTGTYRSAAPPSGAPAPRVPMRTQIAEGLRWLWQHRLLRTLAILLGLMNGTMAMAMAVFALFATDPNILGLNEVGFGFLLTAGAVGSVLGSVVAGRLVTRLGRARALWITLIASSALPIAQGLTSSALVVAAVAALIGFSAVVWNVITVSLRQTIIPDELLGRVNSVYRFLGWGSMPIGALAGGVIAGAFGLRAPFVVGGAVMLLALIPASRFVTARAIDDARAAAVR
jgi:MFS family permease